MTIPAADPLPLPSPPWLLWSLLLLTFFLHLLAMNFVLGGSILGIAARVRGLTELTQWLRKTMPTMVAAAITFGVAPLLFLQALYGRLFFTSSVLMAWFWLAVVPLLIVAYYCAYALAFRGDRSLIAGLMTLIFLAIAFIYTNNMTLMLRADRFLPMFVADARGVQLNLSDPTLVPRYLHMVLGAIAVAGLVIALARISDAATRFGAQWFVGATLVNMLTGTWWLLALPRGVFGYVALTLGAVCGFVAVLFAMVTWYRSAAALLSLALIAMIVTRDEVRQGMLTVARFVPTTEVAPQWGAIAVFAALLVAALGTTAWMLSLLRA